MIRHVKEGLKKHFPKFYARAFDAKRRLAIEYQTLRQIGWRGLWAGTVAGGDSWQQVLPLQAPQRIEIPAVDFPTLDDLVRHVASQGLRCSHGHYTLYLPPDSIRDSAFKAVSCHYPPNAALKILKQPGGVSDSTYLESTIHRTFARGDRHLSLVANLFFQEGVGPRLYDTVELKCGSQVWTVYVVEHVVGRTPTPIECEKGLAQIRSLEQRNLIRIVTEQGWDNIDFECPTCNGNALVNEGGRFYYIDFQNFLLADYEAHLEAIARRAVAETHFGDKRLLGGGGLLYQSVPGVKLPAKRKIEDRMNLIRQLLGAVGATVNDRLVLDVGCNVGMMMGQYLKLGARWCHGWDMPTITAHTEELLRALGCTRFSTTGARMNRAYDLPADLPPFLGPSLEGCVMSYLAVRGHLGWLDALAHIPWSFMVYEGHEHETESDFRGHMDELSALVGCRVGAVGEYQDGVSDRRVVAVVLRGKGA